MQGQFVIGDITPSRYFSILSVVLGVLFALIDSDDGLLLRLLSWQLQVGGLFLALIGTHVLLHRWPAFERLGPWQRLLGSGVLGGVLFGPLSLQLDVLFEQEIIRHYPAALLSEYAHMLPPVLISWLAVNLPWLLGFRLAKSSPASAASVPGAPLSPPASPSPALPAFMQQLAPELRGELISLKAELHYLEVITTSGKALILYNLKDAVAELEADLGLQPHRSYWIARRFIRAYRKQGRQGQLLLADGRQIPVSRRKVAQISALLTAQS